MIEQINEVLESPEMETLMTLGEIKSSVLVETIGRGLFMSCTLKLRAGLFKVKNQLSWKI